MRVQIVLFDGFDLLDAIAPYEVFCAANLYVGGQLKVELVTAEGAREVKSGMDGPAIAATAKLDPDQADIIVVPGASGPVGGEGPDSVPAVLGRALETGLPRLIGKAFDNPSATVVTVCGGSLLLAMAGLLERRYAVTNRLGMDALGATGAIPVQARVVEDGNLVTAGGVTSGLDAALYIVERRLGPQIAHAVEALFEYERRGTVWRKAGLDPVNTGSDSERQEAERERQAGSYRLPEQPEAEASEGNHVAPSHFAGTWDTVIATPVGTLPVMLTIFTDGGAIRGAAVQGDERVDFVDPVIAGERLCWSQRVTKPMRLNLKFEVTVQGGVMSGTAKAGLLPASRLTGTRIG